MAEKPAASAGPAHPAEHHDRAMDDELGPVSSFVSAREHERLLTEVRTLANQIDCMRRDIAVLGADEALKSHVSVATDELDAVIVDTAQATETILDVCETLDSINLPEARDQVSAATARIYEACSFQDITGQRVCKVVLTLKSIETRIAEILDDFCGGASRTVDPDSLPGGAGELLSGPQPPGRAMNQCAVDALLDDLT